jgi:hypothetical protein
MGHIMTSEAAAAVTASQTPNNSTDFRWQGDNSDPGGDEVIGVTPALPQASGPHVVAPQVCGPAGTPADTGPDNASSLGSPEPEADWGCEDQDDDTPLEKEQMGPPFNRAIICYQGNEQAGQGRCTRLAHLGHKRCYKCCPVTAFGGYEGCNMRLQGV